MNNRHFGLGLVIVLGSCANDVPHSGETEVVITVTTVGADRDRDGYSILVDGVPASTHVVGLAAGEHVVEVTGIAENCISERDKKIFTVTPAERVSISFRITCAPLPGSHVMVGAGDIARCNLQNDEATAMLLDDMPGTVFTTGDNAYNNGSARDYARCYEPSWGRHRARTRPAPGNHDYRTPGAAGYFGYFGAAAGDDERGYYSYDVGSWHIISLNSNIPRSATSDQVRWLVDDLAASDARCTMAYWHSPRFSSGSRHGDDPSMSAIWDALYAGGVEIVVNGHDHNYERFAPQTPAALPHPRGIRQFVVGTGGTRLRPMGRTKPNSEVRDATAHGVLQFTLRDGDYDWDFVPVDGQTFADSGSGSCH